MDLTSADDADNSLPENEVSRVPALTQCQKAGQLKRCSSCGSNDCQFPIENGKQRATCTKCLAKKRSKREQEQQATVTSTKVIKHRVNKFIAEGEGLQAKVDTTPAGTGPDGNLHTALCSALEIHLKKTQISQSEVATELGVSEASLSEWMQNLWSTHYRHSGTAPIISDRIYDWISSKYSEILPSVTGHLNNPCEYCGKGNFIKPSALFDHVSSCKRKGDASTANVYSQDNLVAHDAASHAQMLCIELEKFAAGLSEPSTADRPWVKEAMQVRGRVQVFNRLLLSSHA